MQFTVFIATVFRRHAVFLLYVCVWGGGGGVRACVRAYVCVCVCPNYNIVYLQEAITSTSYFREPVELKYGDLEAEFAASDHVLEREVRIGGQVIKKATVL